MNAHNETRNEEINNEGLHQRRINEAIQQPQQPQTGTVTGNKYFYVS